MKSITKLFLLSTFSERSEAIKNNVKQKENNFVDEFAAAVVDLNIDATQLQDQLSKSMDDDDDFDSDEQAKKNDEDQSFIILADLNQIRGLAQKNKTSYINTTTTAAP